ncbi:restriction endonuclease subunit S [Fusobacterium polymorphum]|uniref:restriction endonuclease subunit S n=3 Tax=Fusobacteriaceae TaxID=203492 RepID=UPI0022E94167|nr:restriction endonuclease subunit S [Fusobacterium polymorphum]
MSKLDELIKELCPNGVEYKELKNLCEIKKGVQLNKEKLLEEAEYPVINGGISPSGYWNDYNVKENTITISQGGASAGYVQYISTKFWAGAHCYYLELKDKNINYRYIYHFIKMKQDKLTSSQVGAGIPSVEKKILENLVIPVPPLEVQDEIVRILDNFTALTAELTAELTARKKQYSWYRDYLLKFENKVKIVKLKDIATEMYRGNGIKREEIRKIGIPCIRYGEIYTDYGISFEKTKSYTDENLIINKKYIEYGDILFAITGESVEEIGKSTAYIGKEKCLVGGDILVMKHKQDPVYLSYVLSTENAQKLKSKGKIKSKVVHTNATDIGEIEIPLPPLEVQKRIVEVLDNFEKICNDLNIGLPAEIEARQKQYEFYRNFLLTFKIENCTLPKTRQDKTRQDKTRQDKTRQDIIKLFMYIFGYINIELGEILKIKNGSDYKKFNMGNIPVYGSGGIINYIDTYIYDKESILIPRKGSIGNLFYVDKPFWTVDTIFYTVIDKDVVIPKYLYYYLSKMNLEKLNTAGGVPSLTQTVLNKILISLPSLEEQQRIVDILDRFDKLCNDISEGLPAEIEARQKQYEYYREKLLTFKNIND